ncbi:hypothetical protein C8R45DRAFT_934389 [Mycena sanguinolenta]|nr:hypothetical protein C8R45DRAFT_934389 [Mycena sanguinolenta]
MRPGALNRIFLNIFWPNSAEIQQNPLEFSGGQIAGPVVIGGSAGDCQITPRTKEVSKIFRDLAGVFDGADGNDGSYRIRLGAAESGVADGEDGGVVVSDAVDDSEKLADPDSGSDSEDSRGSGASTTDDSSDDGGGDNEDSDGVDLGAEDGEGYMEEEEEEGYTPL